MSRDGGCLTRFIRHFGDNASTRSESVLRTHRDKQYTKHVARFTKHMNLPRKPGSLKTLACEGAYELAINILVRILRLKTR